MVLGAFRISSINSQIFANNQNAHEKVNYRESKLSHPNQNWDSSLYQTDIRIVNKKSTLF